MKVWFGMVGFGMVDRLGNDAADDAADFGRRRVDFPVIDARRNCFRVCGRWYPVVVTLHRFFIAISRAVVNHVDFVGTTPDLLVWSAGALPKRRRLVHAVRDRGTLGKRAAFLGSLHWPAGGTDLGVGGVSYVAVLILYELWAGERLAMLVLIAAACCTLGGKSVVMVLRPDSGSLPRRVLRMSFWFSFVTLLGLLLLFWRVLSGRFASRIPTWRLPVDGHVAGLVTEGGEDTGVVQDERSVPAVWPGFGEGGGVDSVGGPGGGFKRVRLNRETPANLVSHGLLGVQSRPRAWQRLMIQEHPGYDHVDAKARRVHQGEDAYAPVEERVGIV